MPASTDSPIHTGKRYRTLRDVHLQTYDYEDMTIRTALMPADQIFKPWATFPSWHGDKIPITMEESEVAFDWGIRTGTAHFLEWNGFFSKCERLLTNRLWHMLKRGFKNIPLNQIRLSQGPLSKQNSTASRQIRTLPVQELFEKDNHSRTRLFYAAERGHLAQVKRMCFRMAGTGFSPQRLGFIEKKDLDGKTAADIAEENGYHEVADFLRGEAIRMEYYG